MERIFILNFEKNELKNIQLETITRLSMLEEDPDAVFTGISGNVVGLGKQPAAGLRVLAYRSETMTGTPAYISSPTDAEGRFELPILEIGTYWLLAREVIGGPAATGELYGKLQGKDQAGISLSQQEMSREVRIDVSPHL